MLEKLKEFVVLRKNILFSHHFFILINFRYAMRVSPSLANRLIETAKGLLLKFLPDVYIYVDHQKGPNAGL
jgi:hypothetical protein